MFKKEGVRKIYLPQGKWVDYWTQEMYNGSKWIECDCPLDRIPVFVKWGSTIVKTQPTQYITKSDSWNKLCIEVYPQVSGRKKVYVSNSEYGIIEYHVGQGSVYIKTCNIQEDLEVKIIDPTGAIDGYTRIYADRSELIIDCNYIGRIQPILFK